MQEKTLREFLALLSLAFFAGLVPSALAKLAYMNEDDMVRRAEIIAIVDISHVEHSKTKSWPFDYNEIAYGTVQQTLKRTLPETVKLYGGRFVYMRSSCITRGSQLSVTRLTTLQ